MGLQAESAYGAIDMSIYFCKETLGFFIDSEHGDAIPADVVEITKEKYLDLFNGQSLGKLITADSRGRPQLSDPPPPSTDVLMSTERRWRDLQLVQTDGAVLRHRDELESGKTTLSADQYVELQTYRQALREWPQVETFPGRKLRPLAPQWLSAPRP